MVKGSRGQALFIVFVLLLLMMSIGLGVAALWDDTTQTRVAEVQGLAAFYAAQAGLERAKAQLRFNTNWDGAWLPLVGAIGAATYAVTYTDTTPAIPPYPANQRTKRITSTGTYLKAVRVVTQEVWEDTTVPVTRHAVDNTWIEQ